MQGGRCRCFFAAAQLEKRLFEPAAFTLGQEGELSNQEVDRRDAFVHVIIFIIDDILTQTLIQCDNQHHRLLLLSLVERLFTEDDDATQQQQPKDERNLIADAIRTLVWRDGFLLAQVRLKKNQKRAAESTLLFYFGNNV